MLVDRICKNCGASFKVHRHVLKKNRGIFCSKRCSAVFGGIARAKQENTGEHNPNWKNGISRDNYHYKKLQISRYPERVNARMIVHRAKRNGSLISQPCVVCGEIETVAHHEDYSKPLDVIWMCKFHHRELHNSRNKSNMLQSKF